MAEAKRALRLMSMRASRTRYGRCEHMRLRCEFRRRGGGVRPDRRFWHAIKAHAYTATVRARTCHAKMIRQHEQLELFQGCRIISKAKTPSSRLLKLHKQYMQNGSRRTLLYSQTGHVDKTTRRSRNLQQCAAKRATSLCASSKR
jgi:hypothetical protein